VLHPLARGMVNVSTYVTVTLNEVKGLAKRNSATPRYFAHAQYDILRKIKLKYKWVGMLTLEFWVS